MKLMHAIRFGKHHDTFAMNEVYIVFAGKFQGFLGV